MTAEPSYPVSATPYGQRVATSYFSGVFDRERIQAEAHDRRMAYCRKIEKGLRSNYLVTLQLIIERDPAIPSPELAATLAPWEREVLANAEI